MGTPIHGVLHGVMPFADIGLVVVIVYGLVV